MAKTNTYDAIVIGSGMTGGWAAKELCEKGLKTLVLERGRDVKHGDYPTTNMAPWEFKHRMLKTREVKENYPIQSTNYAFSEATKHFYVNDKENPYSHPEEKPFRWIRGYQVGGRSLIWGRQCYRWSALDFEANAREGIGVDWPIRYHDIEPWYEYVERFIGISGQAENLPQLPDSVFLPPMALNCVEQQLKKGLEENWPDRRLTISRVTNLTQAHNGRGACQYRNLCERGCPYGAYFCSNSATLPAAQKTGNMTLRPHSIVHSIIYDETKDRATGVRVLDAQSGDMLEFHSRIIFCCASTLGTTWLLLHSATSRFSQGLANSSGVLGHYLMDHHKLVGAQGGYPGFENKTDRGQRPCGVHIPRFRNLKEQRPDFLRGYGIWGGAYRGGTNRPTSSPGFGAAFKEEITRPGPWGVMLYAYGECLPYHDNSAELNDEVKDKWGLPTLKISAEFRENELTMRKDMQEQCVEILEATGSTSVQPWEDVNIPGFSVHEMGTARMGKDPKTSVLNGFNQCHDIPNLFITDGSCMASSAYQNPSLTYMALTARACNYAVEQLNRMEL